MNKSAFLYFIKIRISKLELNFFRKILKKQSGILIYRLSNLNGKFTMSGKRIFRYRVPCETHGDVFELLEEGKPTPITCRIDPTDSIDSNNIEIVEIIANNIVTIKEESTPTNGFFNATTHEMSCSANSTTISHYVTDVPSTIFSTMFVSGLTHKGDNIDVLITYEQLVGVILANISPVNQTWEKKNYTEGSIVVHTDSVFGARVYTCIQNTTNGEKPPNDTYWQHGYPLTVSTTALGAALEGFVFTVSNGVNKQNLGVVITRDVARSRVYVKNNPQFDFSFGSMILLSIYVLQDYTIREPSEHNFGQSKIGGTFANKDSVITLIYKNNSDEDKVVSMRLDRTQ